MYARGIVDGVNRAYANAGQEWLPGEWLTSTPRVERVRKRVFPILDAEAIVPVMSELYQDPANAFVSTTDTFYLARDRLLGENISSMLLDARKKAIENSELNERLKRN